MKALFPVLCSLILIFSVACSQPEETDDTPAYVGTWVGTNILGMDITLIADETTYEFDLYTTGTATLLDISQRGTHGAVTEGVDCLLDQAEEWNGTAWESHVMERAVNITINGVTMDFMYDESFPQADPWVLVGQLTKQ